MYRPPNIGVGVVTVSARQGPLKALLDDLATQTVAPSEVSVVTQQDDDTAKRPGDEAAELRVAWLRATGRNLSAARNLIIERTRSDLLIFMDDDARMHPRAIERVANARARYPDVAALTFMAEWTGPGRRRTYPPTETQRRTVRSLTSVASIELAVSTSGLRELGVRFDERFGLGAPFPTGEELILLVDLMRRGGRIMFVPEIVAQHPASTSGAARDAAMMRARGALFRRLFGRTGLAVGLAQVGRAAVRRDLQCDPLTAARALIDGWLRLHDTFKEGAPSG